MTNSRKLAQTWPHSRRSHFVEQMKQASEKWFVSNDYKLHPKYNYCLADWNDWPRNIILPEVTDYIETVRKERGADGNGFALHEYIHHGLSSQALLFNLIGPLITRNDLEPLQKTLDAQGLIWPAVNAEAELEYENRKVFNEDSGQPTSIDVVVGNPDNPGALFIECKFTENRFGGCSVFENGDCDGRNPTSNLSMCYLHYIGRRYWELLQQYGFLQGAITTDSSCILVNHYQFFREVLFALEKGGTFILLSDDRSPTFSSGERGLMPFLLKFVPEQYKNRVGQVRIQDVVKAIEVSGKHDDWIWNFKQKYGMV